MSLASQTRLCKFVGLSCTHNRSFLDFPAPVRRQIYLDAGVFHDQILKLQKALQRHKRIWPKYCAQHYQVSITLLCVCRTVHDEVLDILYSTNCFTIYGHGPGSFEPILNLNPRSLALLRNLDVRILAIKWESELWPSRSSSILSVSDWNDRDVVRQWQRTAKYLFDHITLTKCNFTLECETDGLQTAEQVVEPLSSIRTLSTCTIRLSFRFDQRLMELARSTSLLATGRNPTVSGSFRYFDLPTEIQLMILEYTDLITPLRVVETDAEDKFYLRYELIDENGEAQDDVSGIYRRCGDHCPLDYSAFCSYCSCWAPPAPLFLVSRDFRALALEVFFTKNRFIITPPDRDHSGQQEELSVFPATTFFGKTVPWCALQFLRNVDIALPAFQADYFRPTGSALEDWELTIKSTYRELCLQLLTIRLYISPIGEARTSAGILKDEDLMDAQYHNFCWPFRMLRVQGLRDFFVHVIRDFPWERDAINYLDSEPEFDEELAHDNEHRIERVVMGYNYHKLRGETYCLTKWPRGGYPHFAVACLAAREMEE